MICAGTDFIQYQAGRYGKDICACKIPHSRIFCQPVYVKQNIRAFDSLPAYRFSGVSEASLRETMSISLSQCFSQL